MKLCMYSLDRKVTEDIEVDEFYFPGPKGDTGVLGGHVSLVTQAFVGEVKYVDTLKKKTHYLAVSHGFVRVHDDDIVLCAYTLEEPKQIDMERAIKAQRKAEERMRESFADIEEFTKYELKLHRALVRQQVAKKAAQGH